MATALSPDVLRSLVAKALASRPSESSCGECDVEIDRFAEMKLAGLDASEALPLVEEHLAGCPCCREEFEGLMVALREAEREHLQATAQRPSWWRRLLR